MYICTYMHLYAPICTICTYMHLYAPIRTYMHLYAPICTYTHLYAPIRTYMHLYAPIRTYMLLALSPSPLHLALTSSPRPPALIPTAPQPFSAPDPLSQPKARGCRSEACRQGPGLRVSAEGKVQPPPPLPVALLSPSAPLALTRPPPYRAQDGRLPLHNAAQENASKEVLTALLTAYPEGARTQDKVNAAPCTHVHLHLHAPTCTYMHQRRTAYAATLQNP
jgi:hypothetical protein